MEKRETGGEPAMKIAISDKVPCVPAQYIHSSAISGASALKGYPMISHSNITANFINTDKKGKSMGGGIVGALWAAYCFNADVILSPDDVWLTICYAFSVYVNANAEKLRHIFVDHEGKQDLIVILKEPPKAESDWESILLKFQTALTKAVKADAATVLACNFTTTKQVESIVSAVSTMASFKKYFKYRAMLAREKPGKEKPVPSIRNVIFKGTLEDWNNLQKKVAALNKFECESWTGRITHVIDKFIETMHGKVNKTFWANIANLSGKHLTGWITALIPFNKAGVPFADYVNLPEIPKLHFSASFLLELEESKESYCVKAGFTGISYENEAFRTQLTYAIMSPKSPPKKKKKHR